MIQLTGIDMKMFSKILRKLGLSKPKIKSTPTFETDFHNKLVKKLISGKDISHQDLQIAARYFFAVEVPTANWIMKDAKDSGLIFSICHVKTLHDNLKVTDILLTMKLFEQSTTYTICMSVTELADFMSPVLPLAEDVLDTMLHPKPVA